MSTITVNISFQDRLLADIDRIAHRESRSRSELLREAARLYIVPERKPRILGPARRGYRQYPRNSIGFSYGTLSVFRNGAL